MDSTYGTSRTDDRRGAAASWLRVHRSGWRWTDNAIVTALGRPAEIWQNGTPGSGHWLAVALEGTRSGRDATGARITIVTPSGAQFNHVTSSTGYASASYGPVWFGLGGDKQIEKLTVTWPSGLTQTLAAVETNRILKVREPDSSH